jgi:orotate phosphoribosyltransferase
VDWDESADADGKEVCNRNERSRQSEANTHALSQLLEESGAVLHGHFLLTSGRHSAVYFEKFRVLERPDVLSALCTVIADHYANQRFDFVAGPTTGGIIIAFEVARQMGLPAVYIETENGQKTLRRNKTLQAGSCALVVDDVLTTGTSLIESRQALVRAGAQVAAYAVLIDRSNPSLDLGAPLFAFHVVVAESYVLEDVPDWLAQIPVSKPGTRTPKS